MLCICPTRHPVGGYPQLAARHLGADVTGDDPYGVSREAMLCIADSRHRGVQ